MKLKINGKLVSFPDRLRIIAGPCRDDLKKTFFGKGHERGTGRFDFRVIPAGSERQSNPQNLFAIQVEAVRRAKDSENAFFLLGAIVRVNRSQVTPRGRKNVLEEIEFYYDSEHRAGVISYKQPTPFSVAA